MKQFTLIALTAFLAIGCKSMQRAGHVDLESLTRAIAVISPTQGNTANGTVLFEQTADGMRITADISGLAPNSTHAWHIHEFGDISATNGTATGSHYNPAGHMHGLPEQTDRHAGDFGNLVADASGRARKTIMVHNITIGGDMSPIIGRGVIIHAAPDDGGQPTGNAGARIGQGVIGVAKE